MIKKDFIGAIKLARNVYATVRLTEHKTWYVQVVKKDLLSHVADTPYNQTFKARWSCDCLYID